jgi:hypothetical protein
MSIVDPIAKVLGALTILDELARVLGVSVAFDLVEVRKLAAEDIDTLTDEIERARHELASGIRKVFDELTDAHRLLQKEVSE